MGLPNWYKKYIQTSMFEDEQSDIYLDRYNTKVIVGQFFEYITEQVLNDPVRGDCKNEMEPDFILWRKKKGDIIVEVKATKDKSPIIDLNQYCRYLALIDSDFPYMKPSIFYFFYFYDTEKALHKSGDVNNLLTNILCNGILSCVILPLSLMKYYIGNSSYSFGKWGSGDRINYARVSNSVSTLVLTAERRCIVDAMTLCGVEDFNDKYSFISGYFHNLKILSVDIPPIRYAFIKDKGSKITRGGIFSRKVLHV